MILSWVLNVILFASLLFIAGYVYIGTSLYRAVQYLKPAAKRPVLTVLSGILLLFLLYPVAGVIKELVWNSFRYYEMPLWMIYLFWYGFVTTLQLFLWILTVDIFLFVASQFSLVDRDMLQRLYGGVILVIFVTGVIYTGTRLYIDTNKIVERRIEWKSESLPDKLEDFRITHISDIQADRFTDSAKIQRYINTINRTHPDLVVFTGDLVTNGTRYVDLGARMLGNIDARLGVAATIGDHDYWSGMDYVIESMEEKGFRVMNNENTLVKTDSFSIQFTGVTHVYSRKADPETVESLMDSVKHPSALKILAAHQSAPMLLRKAVDHNYQMFLGGHTHGGQVVIRYPGLKLCAPMFETDYISGRYHYKNLLVNINNGLGFTLAPVRYHAPAEVTVITLKKTK